MSAGYRDRAAGRGFPDWYDGASADYQNAYELGRTWASNMLAAGIRPPAWRGGPPPAAVMTANTRAAELGQAYAMPWGRLPDTPEPVLLEPVRVNQPRGGRFMRGRRR